VPEDKLTALRRELVEYGGLIESMIEKSIGGLMDSDGDCLTAVIEVDEPEANEREIEIDETCTSLIAQYEPKAKDLRAILMIMKMNNDLERIGDHAVNIAHSARYLIDRPSVRTLMEMPRMAEVTIQMLKDSIASFINEDALTARNVCERDCIVDELRNQVIRELVRCMASDPKTIERALKLISIAGNLERIADLSTNMCEEVIFMVNGKVIKHHHDEEA
jgi:phosphate transport system protein